MPRRSPTAARARFLTACRVGPAAASAAGRSARETVARAGSALLVVRRTEHGASVRVEGPQLAILPAGRGARRDAPTAVAS